MQDLRRISVLACGLLVLLRMSIGWQFVYEGLWKLETQDKPQPWTAEGYLKNSQGPLRDKFRELTGDPNDEAWLNYDHVAAEWDAWRERFKTHYSELTEDQLRRLDEMLDGPAEFTAALAELPAGVEFSGSLASSIKFDPERKRLVVDGKRHLTLDEKQRVAAMAPLVEPTAENAQPDPKIVAFHEALNQVFDRATKLSFKERLAASLKGDPERAGLINKDQEGTIDFERMGEIALYKGQLERYEANLDNAVQAFQRDHLRRQWSDLQGLRAKLIGPVRALDTEFKEAADELLTPAQLAQGPVPKVLKKIDYINLMTMWGLIILGTLLIAGLLTRFAALGGAILLFSFYLAMPPWPGVEGLPGPDHSFIVDKNLIEVFALLALTALPTGTWFGVDAIFSAWRRRSTSFVEPLDAAQPRKRDVVAARS